MTYKVIESDIEPLVHKHSFITSMGMSLSRGHHCRAQPVPSIDLIVQIDNGDIPAEGIALCDQLY